MKRPVEIKRKEEIERRIKEEKDATVMKRLLFLKMVSEGGDLRKTAKVFSIAATTGYTWGQRWNKMGYEGIKKHRSKCGRKFKLNEEERKKLKEILMSRNWWSSKEIREMIEKEFGLTYSQSGLWKLLHKMGMHYSKPYAHDYRKPKDADKIMKERIGKLTDELKKGGSKPKKWH